MEAQSKCIFNWFVIWLYFDVLLKEIFKNKHIFSIL